MSKTYLMEKLSGTAGQYAVFQSDGSIASQELSAGAKPQIRITSDDAMDAVTVNGTAASGSGTEWYYNCNTYGSYAVSATQGTAEYTETVNVTVVKQYTVEATFAPKPEGQTFNDCSWANIRAISDYGSAASYWNVGDLHQVTLNGTIGDGFTANNLSTYVFIIGFDHDINDELKGGHTITLQGFMNGASDSKVYALVDSGYDSSKTSGSWFNMKNSNSNSGGWADATTLMRTNIMPAFIAALPTTLQAVLKTVTKKYIPTYNVAATSTCTDKAFLLAESEIYGGIKQSKIAEGSQYTWFANRGISTSSYSNNVRYQFNSSGATSTTCYWWERSPDYSNSLSFCYVRTGGNAGRNGASYSIGVAPAFCV